MDMSDVDDEYIDKILNGMTPTQQEVFIGLIADYRNVLEEYSKSGDNTSEILDLLKMQLNPNTITSRQLVKAIYESNVWRCSRD